MLDKKEIIEDALEKLGFKTTEMKVKITFYEEILGSTPANPDIHSEFIASKAKSNKEREDARKEEIKALIETEGLDEAIERHMTIFPKENGKPFCWDYQIKGMFKGASHAMYYIPSSKTKKLKGYKTIINECIFIKERKIFFDCNDEMNNCERPLRANTPQGARVSLANSETIPAGSTLTFTVVCLDPSYMKYVEEWLNYGALHGFGQWRNSGKGRFTWEEISE